MPDKPAEKPESETQRKFREALERKKQGEQNRPGTYDNGSAVHEAHGKAGGKREFRRKSG